MSYPERLARRATTIDPGIAILPSRQQLLLRLIAVLGGSAKNLDFQKILFLYCQEPDSGKPFDFVPYRYGAFSFTSYADRRKLIALGLIDKDEQLWKLTEKAEQAMESDLILSGFVDSLGSTRGDSLIADTYRRFPYFATRSEIAHRVLLGDKDALERIDHERKKTDPKPLQTIGYEGLSLERYLNVLLRAGVTVLCDVRRNPMSRKYGFAKSTLSNACEAVGIRYEHLSELGIPSDQRQDLQTQADYDTLFETYEREWLPDQTESLKVIQDWIDAGENVALTCYELLPHQCHRHCVAEALEARSTSGLAATHL